MKKLSIYISLLLLLTCAKEDNTSLIEGYQLQISQLNSKITEYSNQVSQLQSTVNSLNNQVNTIPGLEDTITSLNEQIAGLEDTIATLTSEISVIPDLNNEITSLEETIASLNEQIEELEILVDLKNNPRIIYKSSYENHELNNSFYSIYSEPKLPGNPYVAVGLDYVHLNSDGYRDLIIKDEKENGKFRFYINDFEGGWNEIYMLNESFYTFGARKIITVDLNNDEQMDIIYASAPDDEINEKGVYILKNDNSIFTRKKLYGGGSYFEDGSATCYWTHWVTAGDVNKDGYVDIIPGSMPYLYLGNGDYTFTKKMLPLGITQDAGFCGRDENEYRGMIAFSNAELFDINQDGYLDLLGGLFFGDPNQVDNNMDYWKNTFIIFYGNQSDDYFDPVPYRLNSNYNNTNLSHDFTHLDFDNDGDYDLFTTSSINGYSGEMVIQYYENNGDRNFINKSSEVFEQESNYISGYYFPDYIKMVDMNEDGVKELMIESNFHKNGSFDTGPLDSDFNGFQLNENGKFERKMFN